MDQILKRNSLAVCRNMISPRSVWAVWGMFPGPREWFPGGNSVIGRCFLLDLRPKGKSRGYAAHPAGCAKAEAAALMPGNHVPFSPS